MAFSDCEKCWNTPCECGYNYLDWDKERLSKFISTLTGVLEEKTNNLLKET